MVIAIPRAGILNYGYWYLVFGTRWYCMVRKRVGLSSRGVLSGRFSNFWGAVVPGTPGGKITRFPGEIR